MKKAGQPGKQKSAKQPVKNAQGQQGRARKKQNPELDEVRAKQDLLQQLTKQAEENSRILERERAMVLAMEIQTLERDHRQALENGTADQVPPFFEQPTFTHKHYYGGALHPPPEHQERHAAAQQQYVSPQYIVAGHEAEHPHVAHRYPTHQQPAPGHNNPNRAHNFMHQPTRVVDRAHVPGLGDAEPITPEPMSPFHGHDQSPYSPHGPKTFPDSPGFLRPGMVFQIPSQANAQPVVPDVNQHDKLAAPLVKPRNLRPDQKGIRQANPRHPNKQVVRPSDQRPARSAANNRPQQQPMNQVQTHLVAEHPQDVDQHEYQLHGIEVQHADQLYGNVLNQPDASDMVYESRLSPSVSKVSPVSSKAAQQAKQQAYRQELEEQIKRNAERKAAELEARKRAEVAAEAIAAASIPPWDPSAPRRGGGGDPHRDVSGVPVADLRYRSEFVSQQAHNLQAEPSRPQLRIQVPFEPPLQQHMHHHPQLLDQQVQHPVPVQPHQNGWNGAVVANQRGSMPGDVQTSPGGRQFMGAVNQLVAGPSEEQRAHREAQRAALIRDLDEQVRQKREAEARKRAEEEAAIRKEEQELAEHYARLQMDREAEVAAQQHQQQQQMQMQAVNRGPMVPLAAEHSQPDIGNNHRQNRPGARKKLIDADWLPAPGAVQQHNQRSSVAGIINPRSSVVATSNQRGSVGGMANIPQTSTATLHLPPVPVGLPRKARHSQDNALVAEHSILLGNEASHASIGVAQRAKHVSPRPDYTARERVEPHVAGTGGAGGTVGPIDNVASALRMLQLEQKQLREEFSHHAASLQQLAVHASAVAEDRHQAWRDVERVKLALAGDKHGSHDRHVTQGGHKHMQPSGLHADDSNLSVSGQFVVSTHLLPREANNIPTRLPTPIEADWAAAREPLLAGCKPAWTDQEQDIRLRESFLHYSDLCDNDVRHDSDQLFSHHLSTLQERNVFDDDHEGLFWPVSRVVGRPSMIPKPPNASAMHQVKGMPFIGGAAPAHDEGHVWQAAYSHVHEANMPSHTRQQLPAIRTNINGVHTGRPPASPPILRADLLRRSPERKVRQPRSAVPTVMRTRGRQTSAHPALHASTAPGRGGLPHRAVQPKSSQKGQLGTRGSAPDATADAVITRPSREGRQAADNNDVSSNIINAASPDLASAAQAVPSLVGSTMPDE